jgi:hypothetical protein
MVWPVTSLSWRWIAVMLTGPPLAGGLVAFLIWQTRQYLIGNLAGTVVIFGSALGLIVRESVELTRATQACIDAGYVCWPDPSEFTRYAVYAFIGLAEVIALFSYSLRVETRLRRRSYAPEWR